MYNPSTIAVSGLGLVKLDVYSSSGVLIGVTQVPNFQVLIGNNKVTNAFSTIYMTEENRPIIEDFFSKWGQGEVQKNHIKGTNLQ